MAGILRIAVFLNSRPFSKFHSFQKGISNISTEFAKNSRLKNSSHLVWILKKDEITKKQPFAKFQPFATKLSHIHHFPHLLTAVFSNVIFFGNFVHFLAKWLRSQKKTRKQSSGKMD
jgi:hypothetical protein